MALLSGLRVVELPGNPAVGFCAKLFAELGARVTKVQAAGQRSPEDETPGEMALSLFLESNKQVLPLHLDGVLDQAALARQCAQADIVLASQIPAALRRRGVLTEDGCAENPGLILGLITDFGFEGPYADFKGTSLLGLAAGGYLYLNGDPDKEPLRGLELHPYAQTGLGAFLAAMAALLERRQSGRGQLISTSVMQTLASLHEWTSVRYTHGGIIQRRVGNRYDVFYPFALFPTADGHVSIGVHDIKRSNLLLALAGHPEAVGDPRFESDVGRHLHSVAYDALIRPWLARMKTEDLMAEFEAIRLTAAPVATLPAVLKDPHLREQGFWRSLDLPDGRRIPFPGPPVRLLNPAGAPPLASPPPAPQPSGTATAARGPLAGLRVLDVTSGWAGPHGVRLLGDLGADVIRVEAPWERGTVPPDEDLIRVSGFYPNNDPGERYWERSGAFNKFNYNKRAIALRLNTPEGREVFHRLVRQVDIVIDNLSTHAYEELGLGYEWLSSLNPRVVAVTMPGYGRSGPFRYRVSFGPQIEAAIGAVSLMGYEGGEPHMFAVAWPDPCAAMYAAAYALVGIWEREEHGRSVGFEVSQAEAAISFIGPEVVRYGLTGQVPPRIGNRHERYAPHGVYPCWGDDRWLALAVTSDEEWRALCQVVGRPDLAEAPELASEGQRRQRRHEIDAALRVWTQRQNHREAMQLLQRAGVPAFAVLDARDMVENPYFRASSTFVQVNGEILPGFPFHLSRTPPRVRRPVPSVGEHNREVLAELCGYSAEEVTRLEESGIIASAPTL